VSPLRAFVVDDEPPARRKLLRFLADDGDALVVGEAASGEEAVRGIRATAPDVVFLDVQMPGMDGFDVVRTLGWEALPRIVFVTAHDQYAIQALDVHAFAYLLKPFDRTRFARVVEDLRRELARPARRDRAEVDRLLAEVDRRRRTARPLLVEEDERAFLIPPDSIDWVEADRNRLRLHVGERVHTIAGTLQAFTERCDPARFVRLSRSHVVRIDFIAELHRWFHGEYKVLLRSGVSLTWTRRYVGRHPEILTLAKL
jgi:two-component system, LytTR family, response regulator